MWQRGTVREGAMELTAEEHQAIKEYLNLRERAEFLIREYHSYLGQVANLSGLWEPDRKLVRIFIYAPKNYRTKRLWKCMGTHGMRDRACINRYVLYKFL